MNTIEERLLQDKKAIIWTCGKPYASETYYCMTESLEIIASTVKKSAYQFLKDDENIIVMNISTFKKLCKLYENRELLESEER